MPYYDIAAENADKTQGDSDPHFFAIGEEAAKEAYLATKPDGWTIASITEGTKPPTKAQATKLAKSQRDLTHGLATGNPDTEVVKLENAAIDKPGIHTFHRDKRYPDCIICGKKRAEGVHFPDPAPESAA